MIPISYDKYTGTTQVRMFLGWILNPICIRYKNAPQIAEIWKASSRSIAAENRHSQSPVRIEFCDAILSSYLPVRSFPSGKQDFRINAPGRY